MLNLPTCAAVKTSSGPFSWVNRFRYLLACSTITILPAFFLAKPAHADWLWRTVYRLVPNQSTASIATGIQLGLQDCQDSAIGTNNGFMCVVTSIGPAPYWVKCQDPDLCPANAVWIGINGKGNPEIPPYDQTTYLAAYQMIPDCGNDLVPDSNSASGCSPENAVQGGKSLGSCRTAREMLTAEIQSIWVQAMFSRRLRTTGQQGKTNSPSRDTIIVEPIFRAYWD